MADTIVNTPSGDTAGSSSAVSAVAIVAIVLILAGAFIWYRRNLPAPAPADGTNIQVTIPAGTPNSNQTP